MGRSKDRRICGFLSSVRSAGSVQCDHAKQHETRLSFLPSCTRRRRKRRFITSRFTSRYSTQIHRYNPGAQLPESEVVLGHSTTQRPVEHTIRLCSSSRRNKFPPRKNHLNDLKRSTIVLPDRRADTETTCVRCSRRGRSSVSVTSQTQQTSEFAPLDDGVRLV